jgi:8-oxo-dGTP diphosphatase
MRNEIIDLIQGIAPYDDLEKFQIKETLDWIRSGVEIFRLEKPATPPKHLVSYFLLADQAERQVLLVDHKKAQLWLPSGGHVEPGEHPRVTAEREMEEELGCKAKFIQDTPFFLTATSTGGLDNDKGIIHVDVSLWYLLEGDIHQSYDFDQREFHGIRWFAFDKIPYPRVDPQMGRFMQKLEAVF